MAKLQKRQGEKSRENLLGFKGNKMKKLSDLGKQSEKNVKYSGENLLGFTGNKMKNINDLYKQTKKNVKYSGEYLLGLAGNKRGSKRKAGRPRNKIKNINDLCKQIEKNVKYSGQNLVNIFQEDKRTVLDLDDIVRDYMKRMSEFRAKNVQDICIIICDNDHQNIGHDQQNMDKGQKWEEPILLM